MFSRLGPNAARSSDGFEVVRTGRMQLKYREGSRSLTVEVEPGDGLAIYRGSVVGWDAPHEDRGLTPDQKHRIVERICAALDFLGVPYVLD